MFSLFKKKPQEIFVSAIVVAAGGATRMNGIDKQLVTIEEVPVVVRSVEAISACERISEVILVCREEDIANYYNLVRDFDLFKVASVVGGGKDRQASVFNGISAAGDRAEFYAIHDGARPLLEPWVIDYCLDSAIFYGAAATGVPVKDTIKVCDHNGYITNTPKREELFAIHTPQIFAADIYKQAMQKAINEGKVYSDDCQLVEKLGKKVFVSRGSYENIKITTPEDLIMARAILSFREGADGWTLE